MTEKEIPEETNESSEQQNQNSEENKNKNPHIQPLIKSNFNLSNYCSRLFVQEPFYSAISRYVTKVPSWNIPTAGVSLSKNNNFVLYYNPNFFASLTDPQRIAVLEHELLHIVLEHVTSRKLEPHKQFNIAADLAINSFLPDVPEEGCIPGKGLFKNFPAFEATEWYFNTLTKFKEEMQKNGQDCDFGDMEFDDHSGWQELNDEDRKALEDKIKQEVVNRKIKEMLRDAVEDCKQRGWGSLPQAIQTYAINKITMKVNWQAILVEFVRRTLAGHKKHSWCRLHRKYPMFIPGHKRERYANLAICIDQSGSVDDGMLQKFFAAITPLAERVDFTVVPFDHIVHEDKIYLWKKGKTHPWERVACGGTCFDAPTDFVNSQGRFDGMIILTDLCAPKPKPSNVRRLWMTTPEHAAQPYFDVTGERVIVID